MAGILVSVEGDLAEHRRESVLALAAKHGQAHVGVLLLGHDPVERERLAEHRGGFGQSQRRVVIEDVLVRGQAVVETVPKLVRQGGHVAQPACEVQHHVRVVARGHRHAVGSAGFAGLHRSVDPAVAEEVVNQRTRLLRKPVVRAEHELLRVLP